MQRAVFALVPLYGLLACSPRGASSDEGAETATKAAEAGPRPGEEGEVGEEGQAMDPPAKPRNWSFDDAKVGEVPAGITIGETNPANHPARWEVVAREDAPTPPHAFGITACDNPKAAVFEVALLDGTDYGDLEAEVAMFAADGQFDQGGGLIWRARDMDNYYTARWNPLENNVRFYVIVDSERTQLAEQSVTLETGKWHRMHLVVEGDHFEVAMDDGEPLTLDDSRITEPGRIGLWTKSDAKTLFDDLSVSEP